jgi:anaerobic dimethyl sulfoxide reductase subunit C (anchor subunit)
MEPQWPLIVFTLLICLGAGTFGVAGALAGLRKGATIQMTAVFISLVTVVLGGVASFLHLQHFDRAFNGFGHLTSGITQELIALALFCIVAVTYIVLARRGEVPVWAGWVAVVVSVALVITMANSYAMAARPLWDSPLLWLYYLANAVLFGGLVILGLSFVRNTGASGFSLPAKIALAGAGLSVVALIAYAVFIPASSATFTSVGNYFDPTHPTRAMADPQGVLSGFLTGDQALLFWTGALVVGALVPLALIWLAGRRQKGVAVGFAALGIICALAGGLCFRVVLYALGFSVFVFY